jgi:hypothetical protein
LQAPHKPVARGFAGAGCSATTFVVVICRSFLRLPLCFASATFTRLFLRRGGVYAGAPEETFKRLGVKNTVGFPPPRRIALIRSIRRGLAVCFWNAQARLRAT